MVETLARDKRALRCEMSRRRRALSAHDATTAAHAAAAVFIAMKGIRHAAQIGLYAALPGELATRPLFDAVVSAGAAVLFPRTRDDELEFCEVGRWQDLLPGTFGVLEPPAERPRRELATSDVVVVPGLAFDWRGNRVGRGRAFYDRAFPNGRVAPMLVGFGYELQVLEHVPHDERDRPMDAIVTEQRVRDCTGDCR